MTPGQVYRRLVDERNRLRATLAAVSSSAVAIANIHELRESARCLRAALAAYTDIEDELLPTVLVDLDAWGNERVNQLFEEHGRRRALLVNELCAIEAAGNDHNRAKLLLIELIAAVLTALATEEEQVLRADILRDDDINVDEFGG